MSDIQFGTDGWRGRIGDDYTYANVRRAAQGFADYLKQQRLAGTGRRRPRPALLGRALRRRHSRGAGRQRLPSPADTRTHADAGDQLQRSGQPGDRGRQHHRQPQPAGRLRLQGARSAGRRHSAGRVEADRSGNPASRPAGPHPQHQTDRRAGRTGRCATSIPNRRTCGTWPTLLDVEPIKRAGLKVVVDNMWGNGAGWLTEILGGGSTEMIEVHAERNPIFPEMSRPEPIPPNVDAGLAAGKRAGRRLRLHPGRGRRSLRLWRRERRNLSTNCASSACWPTTSWPCAASAAPSSRP